MTRQAENTADHVLIPVLRQGGSHEATCVCTWESGFPREHEDAIVADFDQHLASELRNRRRQLEAESKARRAEKRQRELRGEADRDRQREKREEEAALAVECPKCGAAPDRRCMQVRQYGTSHSPLRRCHAERRIAAARQFASCPRCKAQPGHGCEFKSHNWDREPGKPLRRLHRERIDNLASAKANGGES